MDGYLYLAQMVAVAGVLFWGRLEWYAAVLVGLISPAVTFVLAIILMHVLPRFPDSTPVSSDLCVAVLLVVAGCVVLAMRLRQQKQAKK